MLINAGYETTSSAISWALYNLALHPDHQKMCQKEIDTLTKTSTDDYMCWFVLNNFEDISDQANQNTINVNAKG